MRNANSTSQLFLSDKSRSAHPAQLSEKSPWVRVFCFWVQNGQEKMRKVWHRDLGCSSAKAAEPWRWAALKILPKGSEQAATLQLFGQWGGCLGWLKAVMPRGSMRDWMTSKVPLAQKLWALLRWPSGNQPACPLSVPLNRNSSSEEQECLRLVHGQT